MYMYVREDTLASGDVGMPRLAYFLPVYLCMYVCMYVCMYGIHTCAGIVCGSCSSMGSEGATERGSEGSAPAAFIHTYMLMLNGASCHSRTHGYIHMYVWMDVCMDVCMDGWIDGYMTMRQGTSMIIYTYIHMSGQRSRGAR
jgi:hypothetical protein